MVNNMMCSLHTKSMLVEANKKAPVNGWKDKNPPAHDKSKGAGVIRGRQWRNFVHHNEPKDIDKTKFNQKWTEGTQIITDLGYQYDVNILKTMSLDPKHEIVLKSLLSYITQLETKHDSLAAKFDSFETSLKQQYDKIAKEVQQLQIDKETRKEHSNTDSSSSCLKSVLEYISSEIKENEAKELLSRLNVHADGDLVDKLKFVQWKNIKKELEELPRKDIVDYIIKNTLITRGLQNASEKLREHYKVELIKCLVEQPLSSIEVDSQYAQREDVFIDLVILPSSAVDKEYTNSDRDFLMKQNLLDKASTEKAVDRIIGTQDELIFIRGVAGIGKSTLIDMFTLKWAKRELNSPTTFDFVFKFTCRELNQILIQFENVEQLFQQQYQHIFGLVTLEDLAELSDRVLIIVDGLDELKDIYKMNASLTATNDSLPQLICDLINLKSTKSLKNHKTIVCGRPKACEFVKNQFSGFKMKTVEVCGFSQTNVQKYVNNFFAEDQTKAKMVQGTIASSYNLKIMSTVPVFLWVICNVYSEDLIKRPINTNTELYFYTCLIFLRDHFQGPSGKHKNLLDIVNDQDIINVVFTLMVLSVETYMQNQVLFTDEDIKKLKCPIHLEQTGFIVKYSRSNIAKSTYQFRHLVLQEFFCGMYLCVTKGISPFLSNRELSSCLPTILGIHRIIQDHENEIFLQFFKALTKSNKKVSNYFAKATSRLQNRSYEKFIKKNILPELTLPSNMIRDNILYITDRTHCREFLDLFKETNNDVVAPFFDGTIMKLYIYKNFRNILSLLEKLSVAKIDEFDIRSHDFFDEAGVMDGNIIRFIEMTARSSTRTVINLYSEEGNDRINCTGETLCLYFYKVIPANARTILKLLDRLDIVQVQEFSISSKDLFYANGNMDESIIQLYNMTAGTSMGSSIMFSAWRRDNQLYCTGKGLSLSFYAPLPTQIVLPDIVKGKSKFFFIRIDGVAVDDHEVDMLRQCAVPTFLQEVTKHAIDNGKKVEFSTSSDITYSIVKAALGEVNIEVENEHIRFL